MSDDSPKRILIVDDEVAFLRVMREALTACLRCAVDSSPHSEYGFELAIKKTYDLFIFDFSMPMIDGALLFFLITSLSGNYPFVARIGGSVWVGLLSLIVSMPIVVSRVKKQFQGNTQ